MVRDRFEERWRKNQEGHLRATERPRKTRTTRARTPIEIAADRFGLTANSRGVLSGFIAGLEVKVRCRASEDENIWHATITAPDLPHKLALASETAFSMMKKSIAGEDILCFDKTFDCVVSVNGAPAASVAVLDHVARKQIVKLLPRNLLVHNHRVELTWTTKSNAAPSPDHAAELKKAAALAKRMSLDDRPIPQRLLKNARRDPNPSVRLNNLALLLRSHDPYWKRALSREGILHVTSLALDQTDRGEESLAREALAELALEMLAYTAADISDLQRFSEHGLLALFSAARGDTRLAIVEALASTGTNRATEALLPHSAGLFISTTLKQAVRKTIAAIEERAGSTRGRLAVVPFSDHQGALALSKEEGALGLSDDDEDHDDD
jgi:hypothetical protein